MGCEAKAQFKVRSGTRSAATSAVLQGAGQSHLRPSCCGAHYQYDRQRCAPYLSGRAACAKPRAAGVCFSDTLLPSAILVDVAMAMMSAAVSCLRCVDV